MGNSLSDRHRIWMVLLAGVTLLAAGCRIKTVRNVPPGQVRPAKDATRDQLLAQYNQLAGAVRSLRATVQMAPTAGSTYSGFIEEYHEVKGFILAQKPAHIRVIGQAPVVGKNIFDMTSDGETFRIFIPSKNKFIVGPAALERPAAKPIENLRPQHLLDALFWPEIDRRQQVLFEEFNTDASRYYILTVIRGLSTLEIVRKIWFDRADLSVARVQLFSSGGKLLSDIAYSDWQAAADVVYPRQVVLARPHDDYKLALRITELTLNEEISADRFKLEQPPGTDLVRADERGTGGRP